MTESLYLPDLLGGITIEAGPGGLRKIAFGQCQPASSPAIAGPLSLARRAERQLREYLAGERFSFDLPLDISGSPFQLLVWRALTNIPYGKTASYRAIAMAVNNAKGYRAIGQANHRNPVPIVVPCHRVIAADGSIGGYGGGLNRKIDLLELEERHAPRYRQATA